MSFIGRWERKSYRYYVVKVWLITVDFRSSETASNELYTLKNNLLFPFIFVLVLLLFFSFSNEFLTSEIMLLKNKNLGPLNNFTIYFWLTGEIFNNF